MVPDSMNIKRNWIRPDSRTGSYSLIRWKFINRAHYLLDCSWPSVAVEKFMQVLYFVCLKVLVGRYLQNYFISVTDHITFFDMYSADMGSYYNVHH